MVTLTKPMMKPTQSDSTLPDIVLEAQDLSVYYGESLAISDINLPVGRHQITAIIGPSGAGKSTLLRCFNRMNELIPGTQVEGEVLFDDTDIYAPGIDPVSVRRRIGMVFQKPNPFPKSIYENVALARASTASGAAWMTS
jgi:phosphate transport system ATP-binding protein